MNKPTIIGFCGKAGAGKTTISEILEDKYMCITLSFADPLRRLFATTLIELGLEEGPVAAALEAKDHPNSFLGTSCRQFNRDVGDLLRSYRQDIFLKMLENKILRHIPVDQLAVLIDDCRFDNEAQMVRKHGGSIVKINRDEADLRKLAPHSSENGITESLVDLEIDNVGTLTDLEIQADALAAQFELDPAPDVEELMTQLEKGDTRVH